MKNLAKIASGVFLIGCHNAAPPEAAENLTDAQREHIEQALGELDGQTAFIERLVDAADPLPTFDGKKADDNDHIKELLNEALDDGHWYLEHDRYLTVNAGEIDTSDLDALAPGFRSTSDRTDNYVVLVNDAVESSTVVNPSSGELMHAFSRFYYPIDNPLVGEDILASYDGQIGTLFSKLYYIDAIAGEGIDPLYSANDQMERVQRIREGIDAGTLQEEWEPYLNGEPFEEVVEEQIRLAYAEIQSYESFSEQQLIDEYLDVHWEQFDGHAKLMQQFGVTENEYFDALKESPELFLPANGEMVSEMLLEIEELFPEYVLQTGEGIEVERTAEMKQELQTEMSPPPSRNARR